MFFGASSCTGRSCGERVGSPVGTSTGSLSVAPAEEHAAARMAIGAMAKSFVGRMVSLLGERYGYGSRRLKGRHGFPSTVSTRTKRETHWLGSSSRPYAIHMPQCRRD